MSVRIICGFPGVGKSTLYNAVKDRGDIRITDSDSSKYSKDNFPKNYIDDIQRTVVEAKNSNYKEIIILCSTHEAVRSELKARNIPFTVVYPERSCKAEYLHRYKERGSPQALIKIIDNNWDTWMDQLESETAERKFRLLPGQYLSDLAGHFSL